MPVIVGVTGGTCSGKTTYSAQLVQILESINIKSAYFPQDWYYQDLSSLSKAERDQRNFDEPSAIDNDLFINHLNKLRLQSDILAPTYDYVEHVRLKARTLVSASDVVVVDGLFLLIHDSLRKLMDVSIFLKAPDDVRLIRRIRRDVLHFGLSIEYVLDYWENTIRPMHTAFIEPSVAYANYVLDPTQDQTSTSQVVNAIKGLQKKHSE